MSQGWTAHWNLAAKALQSAGARQVRPRPYTPRPNGKAEPFTDQPAGMGLRSALRLIG